jgi:hypothetical protein
MNVELLSPPANFAVVQLPGRNFPGVVFQGDTLFSLVNELNVMLCLLEKCHLDDRKLEDLTIGIKDIRDQLGDVLAHYETVCINRKITPPYLHSES